MTSVSNKSDGKENNSFDSENPNVKSHTDGDRFCYGEEWPGEQDYFIGIGSWAADKSDEKSLSISNFRVLNLLESGSAISVLEDLVQELIILKYVIGASIVKSWNFEYKSLKERFEGPETPVRMFPEVDSTPVLTSSLKLQRDRFFLENIIKETVWTLLEDGTFEPVVEACRAFAEMHADEANLIEELKQNMAYLKDIKARVEEKRRLEEIDEKERDELLDILQDEIEDVKLKCAIEEEFVNKWEMTRNKQNKWRLKDEEDFYRNKIRDLTTKLELEKTADKEMQTFIKENTLDLEEELEEWMGRYDFEMEKRENKILQLKYTTDQTEEEVKRLKNLYQSRETEIEEWIEFRTIMQRRSAASLIIQSWWRAFMVRKKLGPYKEKKLKPQKEEKKK